MISRYVYYLVFRSCDTLRALIVNITHGYNQYLFAKKLSIILLQSRRSGDVIFTMNASNKPRRTNISEQSQTTAILPTAQNARQFPPATSLSKNSQKISSQPLTTSHTPLPPYLLQSLSLLRSQTKSTMISSIYTKDYNWLRQ